MLGGQLFTQPVSIFSILPSGLVVPWDPGLSHTCGGLTTSQQTLTPHSPLTSFHFHGLLASLLATYTVVPWGSSAFPLSMSFRMTPLHQATHLAIVFLNAAAVTTDLQRSEVILSQLWWLKSIVSMACLSSKCLQG